MKPSAEAVLALLRERPEGLTSVEALHAGVGSRLAARVADLKAAGYPVDAELVTVATAAGTARVARYTLARRSYAGTQSTVFGLDPLPGGVATPLPRASRQGA